MTVFSLILSFSATILLVAPFSTSAMICSSPMAETQIDRPHLLVLNRRKQPRRKLRRDERGLILEDGPDCGLQFNRADPLQDVAVGARVQGGDASLRIVAGGKYHAVRFGEFHAQLLEPLQAVAGNPEIENHDVRAMCLRYIQSVCG
ncbi:hypothetical protein ACVWZK_000113 [Bradyrhizobium sp. GM0.4]